MANLSLILCTPEISDIKDDTVSDFLKKVSATVAMTIHSDVYIHSCLHIKVIDIIWLALRALQTLKFLYHSLSATITHNSSFNYAWSISRRWSVNFSGACLNAKL